MNEVTDPTDNLCDSCGFYWRNNILQPNRPPIGDENPYLYVVGGSPTAASEKTGKIFSGTTSRFFKSIIAEENKENLPVRYYVAAACKQPLEGDTAAIDICSSRLRNDIARTNPSVLLVCGSMAIRGLFPSVPKEALIEGESQGFIVPYRTPNGKLIPAIITYTGSYVYHKEKGKEESSYEDMWAKDAAKAFSIDPSMFEGLNLDVEVKVCDKKHLVAECFEKLKKAPVVAFDIETTDLKPYAKEGQNRKLFSIAFAFEDGTSYTIPLYGFWVEKVKNQIYAALYKWITGYPDQIKIAHSVSFEQSWLAYQCSPESGMPVLQGKYEDTQAMAYLLSSRRNSSDLKVGAWRYLGVADWSVDVRNILTLPRQSVWHYNALDSWYTLKLYQEFRKVFDKSEELESAYRNILLPSVIAFTEIQLRGVIIDMAKFGSLKEMYTGRLVDIEKTIKETIGLPDFNPSSTKQVGAYFVSQGYEVKKTGKGNIKVNIDAIEEMVTKYNDPVAKLLVEHRSLAKLVGTYLDGMQEQIHDDGRLHPNYNLTNTFTGRTSCSEPNMQNFPADESKGVRQYVVSPPGHKIVKFDYGQLEARLFAVHSGDEQYLDDLASGYDIHAEKAMDIFHNQLGWDKDRAAAMRQTTKSAVFGCFYGATTYGTANTLGIDLELAEYFQSSIFDRYPAVKEWQSSIMRFEKKHGYMESLFGRRRSSPMTKNQLLNMPCQSAGSDFTLATLHVVAHKYKIAMMIHDDLTLYLPEEDLAKHISIVIEALLTIPWLWVLPKWCKAWAPMQVSCYVGQSWGNMEQILQQDAVQAGLEGFDKTLDKAEELYSHFVEN